MRKRNKKGQSTMEYVIVLTAIVAAIIFAATTFIRPAMNSVYNQAGESVTASGVSLGRNIGGHT